MPNRKRNQTGIFTHESQDYTRPMRSRGEQIYGNDYDNGSNQEGDTFHRPRRQVADPYGSRNEGRNEGRYGWQQSSPNYFQDDRFPDSPTNYGNDGSYENRDHGNRNPWERNQMSAGYSDRNSYFGESRGQGWGSRDRDRNYDSGNRWSDQDRGNRGGQSDDFSERSGQHRGKGPRGYQRADDRIRDDINDRLADDSYVDASDIEVTVLNGEVTLSGTVDDKHAKRRAEDVVESVGGVKNVENRIRVKERFGDINRSGSNTDEQRDEKKNRQSSSETVRHYN